MLRMPSQINRNTGSPSVQSLPISLLLRRGTWSLPPSPPLSMVLGRPWRLGLGSRYNMLWAGRLPRVLAFSLKRLVCAPFLLASSPPRANPESHQQVLSTWSANEHLWFGLPEPADQRLFVMPRRQTYTRARALDRDCCLPDACSPWRSKEIS